MLKGTLITQSESHRLDLQEGSELGVSEETLQPLGVDLKFHVKFPLGPYHPDILYVTASGVTPLNICAAIGFGCDSTSNICQLQVSVGEGALVWLLSSDRSSWKLNPSRQTQFVPRDEKSFSPDNSRSILAVAGINCHFVTDLLDKFAKANGYTPAQVYEMLIGGHGVEVIGTRQEQSNKTPFLVAMLCDSTQAEVK